jgi:ketosteroid isomerase-like protein
LVHSLVPKNYSSPPRRRALRCAAIRLVTGSSRIIRESLSESFCMYRFAKKLWFNVLFLTVLSGSWLVAQGQQTPVASAGASPAAQGVHEMQLVEDRWSDAVTKRDQYALELVLAPQFIGISATGDVTTRNQQISRLFVKGEEPVSLEQKVISARFLGDVAIVNGTYVMRWKLEKGPVDEKGIFSHVFEKTRSGWLCLNSQQTVVAEQAPHRAAAPEKPKEKPSNAELPMHIPLIYKGPGSTQPAPAPGSAPPPS